MSRWVNLTFDVSDDRLPAAELALRRAAEYDVEHGRQEDAGVDANGNLSVKCGSREDEYRPLMEAAMEPGDRAFAHVINDTVNAGTARIYERAGDAIELRDTIEGEEGEWGADVSRAVQAEYGVELLTGTGFTLKYMLEDDHEGDVTELEPIHRTVRRFLAVGETVDYYDHRRLRERVAETYPECDDLRHAVADRNWREAESLVERRMPRPPLRYDFESD